MIVVRNEMTRNTSFLLISLMSIVLSANFLISCKSGRLHPNVATLHLIEHARSDYIGDVMPEGDSVGDTLGFSNELFDETNKNKVGTANGFCIRTAAGEAWECAWTISLTQGQIMVQGPFYDNKDSVLTITGGTGKYYKARGSMTLHSRNKEGTEYDFIYEIIH